MFGICYGVWFLLSGALLDAIFTLGGSTVRVCTPATPLSLPMAGIVQPGDGHWSMHCMYRVAAPSTTLNRGSLLLLIQLFPNHPIYMVGHTGLGAQQKVTQSLCLPYMVGGSSFPGLVPSNHMVNSESVIGIKPGPTGVVIGYQVDESTHTWSAEWFVALFHIYPGFTGKVSSLTLEPGCGDYSFLDQAVADFEQGLVSILTNSLETPELDTSLDESDAITSSISSGFLPLVSTF